LAGFGGTAETLGGAARALTEAVVLLSLVLGV
jgi:hypothetical protein